MRFRWRFVLAFLLVPGAAQGQELSLLLGRAHAAVPVGSSDSWQLDFRYNPVRYIALSVSYLNEGHPKDHKRDGVASQVWGRVPLFKRRVSLDFGGGAYYYFDTATLPNGTFADVHGLAGIYSASATYYSRSPWFGRVVVNHVRGPADRTVNTYVLGVGYHLWKEDVREAARTGPVTAAEPSQRTGDEVMLFLGRTVVNSLEDQKGIASGIEFRKGIVRHLDWTATWLSEGDVRAFRREGVGSQLWLVDSYFDDRLVLGAGGGGYLIVSTKGPLRAGQAGTRDVAILASLTAGYRFAERWLARFTWNRVLTDTNSDSDVFALGAGYRWKE